MAFPRRRDATLREGAPAETRILHAVSTIYGQHALELDPKGSIELSRLLRIVRLIPSEPDNKPVDVVPNPRPIGAHLSELRLGDEVLEAATEAWPFLNL
jgi:hypothetical protein